MTVNSISVLLKAFREVEYTPAHLDPSIHSLRQTECHRRGYTFIYITRSSVGESSAAHCREKNRARKNPHPRDREEEQTGLAPRNARTSWRAFIHKILRGPSYRYGPRARQSRPTKTDALLGISLIRGPRAARRLYEKTKL